MQNPRALGPDESERVIARARELVRRYGDQSKAARALGVSQQTISKVLAPHGTAGVLFARKVAEHLGMTFDERPQRLRDVGADVDPWLSVHPHPLPQLGPPRGPRPGV